jgi:hypothetical protein
MRSPAVAMLWENWRLTRNEAAQRLVQGIVLCAAVLAGGAAFGATENGPARWALGLLWMTYTPIWMSVARLNGGRFMDGYRPGYPFYFLYTRPVRTFVLVGAPVTYNSALAVAAYLVSALVLRAVFGYPFPLLPLAAWIFAGHIAQWTVQWGTSNKVAQWVGSIVVTLPLAALAFWRAWAWPARLDVPLTDYALLASIAVVSFGLAVAGVARQRRGDARASIRRAVAAGGFSNWFAGLSRFPCPTTSATLAQVWFDLRFSGLAVLTAGAVLALLIPQLFMLCGQIDVWLGGFYARPVALAVGLFSMPTVMLFGGNAFGIRTRQGGRYAAVFESTQPYGTARIAALKVAVRSICLLTALAAVVASFWTSASVIPFDVLDDQDTFIQKARSPLSGWMRAIESAVRAMSAYQLLALALVTFMVVAAMIAWRAMLPALRARFARRVNIVAWVLLLHGLVLVLLALAARRGFVSEYVAATMLTTSKWGVAAAIVLATLYVAWRTFAERLLTLRSACVAVFVCATFGAAWVTVLRTVGVPLAAMPTMDAVWILSPTLLPLMASVLAPWSLNRIRHA